ncbi:MAG: FitA-like ribbon-helix-helix domain-containing protein [Planctomycetota bacterium]
MSDILVRGVDDEAMKRLRARAKRHGRSLQSEARLVLERAAGADPEEITAMLDGWKQRFAGRKFSRSAKLIREDRKR